MIDLHTHTTFSDGSLTPEELVDRACGLGLTALGLTDHDCTSGIERFLKACAASAARGYRDGEGLIGVPGVEISADVPQGTLHMLGFYVQPGEVELEAALSHIRDGRAWRNEKILERLNELGLEMSWDEVACHAGEDVVGRPHFAKAMMARQYVSSKQEAFDVFLAKGQKAYVDRFRLTPEECIQIILGAGGVPAMSHPLTLKMKPDELREYVGHLRDMGLQGIEVFYSEHGPKHVEQYRTLAGEFDLVMTGGSDFHGDVNPGIELGRGFGSLHVLDEVLEALIERRDACRRERVEA